MEITKEIERCKNDIAYFVEKYMIIKTPNGFKPIKLSKYQKDLFNNDKNNQCPTIYHR